MVPLIDPGVRQTWRVPEYERVFWLGKCRGYCVVIPVLNEGRRILNFLDRVSRVPIADSADIIIVDGGSTDDSLEPLRLQEFGVQGLLVKTGPGALSAQLRCAYAFALEQGYAGIVTIDGNDKDDPDAVPNFMDALRDGADFVQASRFISGGVSENTPFLRDFAIRFIHAPILSLVSGFPWTDTTQGFRAYSRRILLDPRVAPFRDVFMSYELLAYMSYRVPKLGYRCLELPTSRRYPKGEVPTKISSIRGNLALLRILFCVSAGQLNPPSNP